MGISAMIWPLSDPEIQVLADNPTKLDASTNHLNLHSKDPSISGSFAYIHSAKKMPLLLEGFANQEFGVQRIGDSYCPYFSMSAARVRSLHENQMQDLCGQILIQFPTMAINRVTIGDVVRFAAESNRGLMFYIFEDW